MKFKIVADSSSETKNIKDVPFSLAPLKIITAKKEYLDDDNLNVTEMVEELSSYKGKSSTACPSVEDWMSRFDNADYVFCVTITSGLSGSYNSANIAKSEYEESNPGKKVFVVDSLSAGPALKLIIEKLAYYIKRGLEFDEICEKIIYYREKLGTLFVLQSMRNLANNGRVSPIAAKAAGILGIRAIGKASDEGTIELLDKARGPKNALNSVLSYMEKMGWKGGAVKISHCNNLAAANELKVRLEEKFKAIKTEIINCKALCSFYAENGGLIIGFEKN